jgi:hypothetical protein
VEVFLTSTLYGSEWRLGGLRDSLNPAKREISHACSETNHILGHPDYTLVDTLRYPGLLNYYIMLFTY